MADFDWGPAEPDGDDVVIEVPAQARSQAIDRLKRAASLRELRDGQQSGNAVAADGQSQTVGNKPKLVRTASERARDQAMAKLMGGSSSSSRQEASEGQQQGRC